MKRWLVRLTLLAGYAVPYAALAMYGDERWGHCGLHIAAAACIFVLCCAAVRTANLPVCALGNAISLFTSLVWQGHVSSPDWNWYFKPFSPVGFVILLTAAAVLLQAVYIWRYLRRRSGA